MYIKAGLEIQIFDHPKENTNAGLENKIFCRLISGILKNYMKIRVMETLKNQSIQNAFLQ